MAAVGSPEDARRRLQRLHSPLVMCRSGFRRRKFIAGLGVPRRRIEVHRLERATPRIADLVHFAVFDQQQGMSLQGVTAPAHDCNSGAGHDQKLLIRSPMAIFGSALRAAGGDDHLRRLHSRIAQHDSEAATKNAVFSFSYFPTSRKSIACRPAYSGHPMPRCNCAKVRDQAVGSNARVASEVPGSSTTVAALEMCVPVDADSTCVMRLPVSASSYIRSGHSRVRRLKNLEAIEDRRI